MGTKKAALAKKKTKKSRPTSVEPYKVVRGRSMRPREIIALQKMLAVELAKGSTIPATARKFSRQLVPHETDPEIRERKARNRLRNWMRKQKFRDLLWKETITQIDMQVPGIVDGIIKKAQAGRVDAARLALELNGRHSPHTEVTPAQVNIVIGGVPRPQRSLPEPDVDLRDEEIEEAELEPD